MTTTSENPNDRFNRIEATFERLAELTFQNAVRYDTTLNRHDQAIAHLLEVISRNSEAVTQHDEVLSRLEASSQQFSF